jgi:LmbE family N-acetylglucosaminyl deacetylase
MATVAFFHAHPDDESIGTGGTIAKAVAHGHRVVVVVATKGENGARPEGLLAPGEELGARRVAETVAAAGILGLHRLEFLGYRDSGMIGSPENNHPSSFWAADVDQAARRLATILVEEQADVLAVYDENGVTGHPDHIQVHRVGLRAAELAGTPEVVEGTLSRSQANGLIRYATAQGHNGAALDIDLADFGTPDDEITDRVDVRDHLDQKRAAMAAHASQISETSFFLTMPPDVFEAVWGHECLIRRGPVASRLEDLLVSASRRATMAPETRDPTALQAGAPVGSRSAPFDESAFGRR